MVLALALSVPLLAQEPTGGGPWPDTDGKHINAHGGGIMAYGGTYYWYGECRSESGKPYSSLGVSLYTSRDLKTWKNRGLALSVSSDEGSDIEGGCIIERPKVVFCEKTKKFVMWFHLELKNRGYAAARCAVATSDTPEGPFKFVRSGRVCPGVYPIGFAVNDSLDLKQLLLRPDVKWWTPEWRKQVERGMYCQRDVEGGQMSRDMTIFVDDDGRAYHIYSSEENLTLHIAQLTDDYTDHNGTYVRVTPCGHNEAPAIFKSGGWYWLITSGCTGWAPNAARMSRAKNIFGPWEQLPNPCEGDGAEKTFGSQSTFVLHLQDKKSRKSFGSEFIFMADIWNPDALSDSRHLWIPITFKNGIPVLAKPATEK